MEFCTCPNKQESPAPGSAERSSSSMNRSLNVYQKRPGFADAAGVQYERLLSALLFLRALNRTDNFELAQNMHDIGSFDDNVLFCHQDDCITGYFIQQKHFQKEERSDCDITHNLLTYFISFELILEKYNVDELEVVFYTNSQLSKLRLGEDCSDHILSTGGYRFQYTLEDDNIQLFLSELKKYKDILCQLCECSSEIIKTDVGKIKAQFKCKDFKSKLSRLEMQASSEMVMKMIDEIKGLDNETKFESFLKHLNVFHCQTGEKSKIMKLIETEFHTACGTNDEMVVDDAIKLFMNNIDTWSNKKGESIALTADAPLWKKVLETLINNLNSVKLKELESLRVQFNEIELKTFSEKVQGLDSLKISVNSHDTSLSLLKVYQVLEGSEPHLVLSANAVESHLPAILQLCQNKWCSALLVDGMVKPQIERELKQKVKKLFIIVSTKGYSEKVSLFHDTCNILQLDEASQESLKMKQFTFQGYNVCLKNFLEKDPKLIDVISGDVLALLISSKNPIEVGRKLQPVVNYYIPQTLVQKRNVKKEILRCRDPNTLFAIKVDKKVFSGLIHCYTKYAKKKYRQSKKLLNETQIIHLKNKSEEEQFKEQMVAEGQNVHLLKKDKNGLYWKWSKGVVDVIRHFIDPIYTKTYPLSLAPKIPGELRLIIAEPGMGKTTLLNQLAHQTKQADPSTCVITINLFDQSKMLENDSLDKGEQENFLKQIVSSGRESDILEDALLNYIICNLLNVVILIDGFDEISPYYAEGGIKLLKNLQKKNVGKLWITSRPVLNEKLQNELSTLPLSLEPFSTSDQKNFLMKYWKSEKVKPNEVEKFVGAVLKVMERSLGKHDIELAAIPLQTMLIAEAFKPAYEIFVKTGDTQLPKQLDLIKLYELFIEKKYAIYLESREGISQTNPVYKKHFSRCEKENYEKHSILALTLLLSEDDLKFLNYSYIMQQHNMLLKDSEEIARVGIVSDIHDGKAHFVHRTFAEYFLALWLINNFHKLRQFLLKKLFDPSFRFILNWFDQMLAKGREIHEAVLSDDESKIRAILNTNADIEERDDGGRTPVHLAIMYGRSSILKLLLSWGASVDVIDQVLAWKPIQYADHSEAWESVDILLQSGANTSDLHNLSDIINNDVKLNKVLSLSFERGYTNVVAFILSKNVKVDKVVDCEGSTLLHTAARFGHTQMLAYLMCYKAGMRKYGKYGKSICPFPNNEPVCYSDLLLKLKKLNVNIANHSGYTPLHLAVIGGHKETVQFLLKVGGNINHRDGMGYTQLHWAVRTGCLSQVKRILSYDANVNKLSTANETPLHLAVQQVHYEKCNTTTNLAVIQSLLAAGASMHFEDSSGLTPVHWASANTNSSVLRELIRSGADVRETDHLRSSALHWAAWRGNSQNVHLLLQAGAQCNAVNAQGNTPLHWAAAQGHIAVMTQLLCHQADVNVFNNSGCTPLCIARKNMKDNAALQLIVAGGQTCGTCYNYITASQ
ncbi:uncharacterized protein [Anabrus simplex]|uniref:uncharacterized protein isoform X2 n=1 Tax=Anabrus simplex TaxID=316456 RepID=UPI0035A2DDFE